MLVHQARSMASSSTSVKATARDSGEGVKIRRIFIDANLTNIDAIEISILSSKD
jgi:hypothetical protein